MLDELHVTEFPDTGKWVLSFGTPDAWNPKESLEIDARTAKQILWIKSLIQALIIPQPDISWLREIFYERIFSVTKEEDKFRSFLDTIIREGDGVYVLDSDQDTPSAPHFISLPNK